MAGGFGFEQPSEASVADRPRGDARVAESAPGVSEASRNELVESQRAHVESRELEELRAEVGRLERELERYRAHAERTSKLFLSATNHAEQIRASARRDAELVLGKARTGVERLAEMTGELERTGRELIRQQSELARLEALTDTTRTRLRAFFTTVPQTLDGEGVATPTTERRPAEFVR